MKNPFEVYTSLHNFKKAVGLDWEESAADTRRLVEGVYDENRKLPSLNWLALIAILSFSILIGRVFYLQIVKGGDYNILSENNRMRSQVMLAPRGLIYDRYGQVLAQNVAGFNLVAVPFDLHLEGLDLQLTKLSEYFGFDIQAVEQKLNVIDKKSIQPIIIKQNLTHEQSIWFETHASEFVGFSVQKVPTRQYPEPEAFSHLLGYTGLVGPEDNDLISKGQYDANDFIGKYGIELSYEQYLHGINGQNQVEVDATGKLLNVLGEDPAKPGNSLVLNIDKDLQTKLFQSLTGQGQGRTKAAAIALNPKNGQVLALVSLPGFDNNLFAQGIKSEDYQKLINNPNLPLFDRAIAGTYPPGSTVKPMVASAALSEGIVNEKTIIVDRGVLVIPNQFDPSVSFNFYGWQRGGLGPMNVISAIAQSSDIYFYTVGGGQPNSQIKGLGAEKLAEYYRKFGLGKPTGIDLQGEKPGLVADPQWKENYFKDDAILRKWYLGDTYHISIGQGDMLATPLQVALWTAIIANNGIGYKPEILNTVKDMSDKVVMENKPEILIQKFLSDAVLKIVQEGMRQTILSGSGKQLASLPISAAGKTGTSQFDSSDPKKTHAWFTAYAPYEDPQIVVTVLVEAGGEGHIAAEPVVKQVLQWWAENRHAQNKN